MSILCEIASALPDGHNANFSNSTRPTIFLKPLSYTVNPKEQQTTPPLDLLMSIELLN